MPRVLKTPETWLPKPVGGFSSAMTRYTPDHHKPRAQPAYPRFTVTTKFLDSRRSTHIPATYTAPTGPTEDRLFVTVDRPTDPYRYGIVSRDRYPPCPSCTEPVITIRTLGPHRHTADPCGCALDAHTVAHFLRGPRR